MLMLYTELFYKKALHIFRFQEKKNENRQRTEARITATHATTPKTWKLGITLLLSLSHSLHFLFHFSHSQDSAICVGKAEQGKKQEMRMHINISQRRVTNEEDLLQDVYFFLYVFILIYTYVAEERKLKTLRIPIELVEKRNQHRKKVTSSKIKSNKTEEN